MIRDIPGHVAVFFITVYQRTLSPDTGFLRYAGFSRGGVCRFNPTCSEYTKNTILSHGLIKGVFLGARQLSQCHPWHQEKIESVKIKIQNTSSKF